MKPSFPMSLMATAASLTILSLGTAATAHTEAAERAPSATSATPAPTRSEESLPLDPRFSPERIEADVSFLADDLLEGRMTGTRGHEIASLYAAQRFASLGLEPGGDLKDGKRSWFQQVLLQKTVPVPGSATMELTRPDGTVRSFKQLDEVGIAVDALRPEGSVSAPLAFVGYGLVDKRLGIDDYKGLDVRGKIVVAFSGFPEDLPSEEAAYLVASRRRFAAEHGAVGLVRVPTEAYQAMRPWEQTKPYIGTPDYSTIGPDGKAEVEEPELLGYVTMTGDAAADLFVGAKRSFAQVRAEAAKRGARPRGFALPGKLAIAIKSTTEQIASRNVVGILRGSDPVLKDEFVVLSGHLDHLAKLPESADGEVVADRIRNGALDNAAGSAVTMEVARVFAEDARKPRRSLVFLLSTGEEVGLLGAGYYADHPTVPGDRIVGDVDLDMPILLYPFTDVVAFGADHSSIGRLTAAAVAPMGIALSPDPTPAETLFVRSDHYRFVRKGVPAVFLATGYANGGEAAGADFMRNRYHQPGDDLSQPLNWRAGARFAEANWRITTAMADADEPPLWLEGDFFGEVFAPGKRRAAK